jgi:uncharacterized membrane protein
MILPTGFALPPLPYLVALVVGVGAVAALLYRERPPVTDDVVLALAPWMVAGAVGYVLFQIEAVPPGVRPLFGSPAVYLSTFVFAGAVWAATAADGWESTGLGLRSTPGALAVTGGLAAGAALGYAVEVGTRDGAIAAFWPTVSVVVAVAVTALAWGVLWLVFPIVDETGKAGPLVVFAHALDGVSTAVGGDVLGFGEQTPLSRAVLEFAASLPTEPLLGSGWLFIVVKVVVASAVLYLLADGVRERPREGYVLLAGVAAVGLGPGAHNVVLFAVA